MTQVYLPQVHGTLSLAGEGEQQLMPSRAIAFALAWLGLLGERRELMDFDHRLAEAAQLHAAYLDSRTGDQLLLSMHRGRSGSYANERVWASGYRLPEDWNPQANMVESCARDGRDPATAAVSLAAHEGHRQHMLGENGFVDHVVWGVGCAGDDYVCVICPPEQVT